MVKFAFSIVCYVCGLSSLVAFFWFTEFGIDQDLIAFRWSSAIRNALGFCIFPLQHSILARFSVQKRMETFLDPRLIRPVYVGTSGAALWLVLWIWEPMGPLLYRLPYAILFRGIFLLVIVLLILCTMSLHHRRMFGLEQGYAAWKGIALKSEGLKTGGMYRRVRHPITSLLVVALWAQESMSAGRLLWNLLFTSYALLGTILEERTLRHVFGDEYRKYAERVPAFIPHFRPNRRRRA